MSPVKKADNDGVNRLVAQVLARRKEAEKGYRERALKLFPPICAHCGREFSGKKLKELTVHHKDHNHDNNPPDGSNWELLCLYCHENAHGRQAVADAYDLSAPDKEEAASFGHKPFAGLGSLLKKTSE
ncbi:MAG: YajD family HNH nuclease [Thermodesulfobacteriota bacterium]